MEKKNFYFTFGQQYSHEPHPMYSKAHPDGWLRIIATDHWVARDKAFEILGPHFATSYSEKHWEPEWFPMGEIEAIEV